MNYFGWKGIPFPNGPRAKKKHKFDLLICTS